MPLELIEALEKQLARWRSDLGAMERYGGSPPADALRRCIQDIEGILVANRPEWVNVKDVAVATGRSRSYLQSRCRNDLVHRGLARKTPRGWEMALLEAQGVPPRRERIGSDPDEDINSLARRLGRGT